MIDSPNLPLNHPARVRACEDALEEDDFELLDRGLETTGDDFRAFTRRAMAAGWLPEEIAAAMVSLGEKYVAIKARRIPGGYGEGEDINF